MAQFDLQKFGHGGTATSRLVSIFLGVAATLTSLFITVIAGEERGATSAEKAVWIATGVVILLAAHLLPALTKGAPIAVKGLVLPIWIGALLATGYTHATFFLNAQGRVGDQRASAVAAIATATPLPASRLRGRTQIAADVASTLRNLALLDTRRCSTDCAAVVARRKALLARLDALKIEDAEAVRAEKASDERTAAVDRSQKAQAEARMDPFIADLASFVRLGANQISLLVAIVLGWLVDAVAVVSWASVARPQTKTETTTQEFTDGSPILERSGLSTAPVVELRAAANEPLLDEKDAVPEAAEFRLAAVPAVPVPEAGETSDAVGLVDLADAIRAGRVKCTLTSIRKYRGCTDGAAMALRRRLAEEHPDLFRPMPRAG